MIYIVKHREYKNPVPSWYKEIGVGQLYNGTGENINHLNKYLNEATAYYDLWKNSNDKTLGVCHYRRFFAENGKIVLQMFENSQVGYYDAILMDVRMPEMAGLEATAAIRALDRPDAKTIPIIALTANAFDEDVQRSLQVGMDAHLSKPVDPEHLYQTLEELIWEYSQTRAL